MRKLSKLHVQAVLKSRQGNAFGNNVFQAPPVPLYGSGVKAVCACVS